MWLGILACLLVVAGCSAPREPDHVEAYQAIVAWFYGEQPIPATTFAVDAASTSLPEPSRLVDAPRADPRYAHHQIIDATREQREHRGATKDLTFTDGFLIESPRPHSMQPSHSPRPDLVLWPEGSRRARDRPLHQVVRAVVDAGFDLRVVDEPEPSADTPRELLPPRIADGERSAFLSFLFIVAHKPAPLR